MKKVLFDAVLREVRGAGILPDPCAHVCSETKAEPHSRPNVVGVLDAPELIDKDLIFGDCEQSEICEEAEVRADRNVEANPELEEQIVFKTARQVACADTCVEIDDACPVGVEQG